MKTARYRTAGEQSAITETSITSQPWPAGSGKMARLVRAHDWRATQLGPLKDWPQALRTAVELTLATPVAAIVLWGPKRIQIYNDLWMDIHPGKHPECLGVSTHDCFPELVDVLEPLYERVWAREDVVLEESLLPVLRHGSIEDAWWNVTYTPLSDQSGAVGGIFCTLSEVTAKVLAAQSLHESESRFRALATAGTGSDVTGRKHAELTLRESEERQVFLLKLSDALRPLADANEIQDTASRILREHLGVNRVCYFEVNDEAGEVLATAESISHGIPPFRGHLYSYSTFDPQALIEIRKGHTLLHDDVKLDPITDEQKAAFASLHVGAWAQAPLIKGGRYEAALVAYFPEPHHWTSVETSLLEETAERTWAAVERARAEAGLRESEERQAYLLELSDALRPLDDPTTIQDEAMRLLGKQLGVSRAQYYIADETGEYLSSSGGYTDGVPAAVGRFRLIEFGKYAYDGFHAGETQVVSDATTDPRISETVLNSYQAVGFLAYIGVPFVQRGRLLGTVAVHQTGPRQWTDSERMMVEETAERAGIAIEQARAELALRKSEEKYRTLFETMDQGYEEIELIRDADGNVTDYKMVLANPAYERIVGFSAEKLLGRPVNEVLPDVDSWWLETFVRVATSDISEHFEREEPSLGIWLDMHVVPRDKDHVFVLFDNVTERKRAETALRESEQRYHALFAASPIPLMALAPNPPDYTIVGANDAYFVATKTTRESLIGRRLFDVFTDDPSRPGLHGSEALDISLAKVLATRQTDAMPRIRYDLVVPGGFEPHWWEAINAPVLDASGEISTIIHQVTRVTELHYAEEKEREYRERQAFLLQLSDALRPFADPVQIQTTTMRMLGEHLHLSRAFYFTVELVDGDWIYVVNDYWHSPGLPDHSGRFAASAFGRDVFARMPYGEPAVWDDMPAVTTLAPAELKNYLDLGIYAWIAYPIIKGGEYVGGICVHNPTPRHWTERELALIGEVADRTWTALERAKAEAALRGSEASLARELANTKQLQEVSILLNEGENKEALYGRILDAAVAIMRADFASLQRFDPETNELVLLGHRNFHPESAKAWQRISITTGTPCGGALRESERLFTLDAATYDPKGAEFFRLSGIRSCQSTPLTSRDGRLIGMMSTHWRTGFTPAEEDYRSFDVLVRQTADAFERADSSRAIRESEERFRLFVENVREYALVQTDFEGIVTSWNPGAERLFGYSSREIIGKPFVTLFPEPDRHDGIVAREMAKLSRGEKNIDAHTVQRKNGSQFWAEWVTEPVLDDAGKLRGTAKVMRDETERQQSEIAIRNSLAEKEELLKEVHHRVKNNLQVITSLLNLQAGTLEDERTLVQFEEARNRVQSISAIHELLYKSVSFASVSLRTYAEELLPSLVEFYGMQSRVSATVIGDDVTIELERAVPYGLLLNELVSNALKHAFPDGRRGEMQIEVGRSNGDIHLRVSDNGVGLPADRTNKSSASLGLKLVKILMRQLGGQIEVVGKIGTTFQARFPANDAKVS